MGSRLGSFHCAVYCILLSGLYRHSVCYYKEQHTHTRVPCRRCRCERVTVRTKFVCRFVVSYRRKRITRVCVRENALVLSICIIRFDLHPLSTCVHVFVFKEKGKSLFFWYLPFFRLQMLCIVSAGL